MRLMRHGQSRWRFAAFVAVLGLHVLAGLLLFAAGRIRISPMRALGAPLSLLWLSEKSPPQRAAASPAAIPKQNLKRNETLPDIGRPTDVGAPESSTAITLPLDAADAFAQQEADKEEKQRRWRNLAGPSESQLEWSRNNVPLLRDYHQRNDIEHAEGGEIITWMNDKCFYTTHGISTLGLPQTSMVCKDPPKPETELFKDMRKKLDDSAKGRAP
jgi:hypothetical protein